MIKVFEHLCALSKDFIFLSETEQGKIINKVRTDIEASNYDFGLVQYRQVKNRTVATFLNNDTENVLLRHLFKVITRLFKIKFSDRDVIMSKVFDYIDLINGKKPALSDFSLVRFDFKDFFYSISTSYIFEKYLKVSYLNRENTDILSKFIEKIHYCCAGISLSNAFAEIIAKDFDERIKLKLSDYNVVLYERFVDDGIFITEKYIPSDRAKRIIEETIKEVFFDQNYSYLKYQNKTQLNQTKFYYLSNRDYSSLPNAFDFLGYHFSFDSDFNFSFGIAQAKIEKYEKKIELFFSKHYITDPVLTKYFILCYSSRVIYESSGNGGWVNKGIISTYKELKRHLPSMDSVTSDFLKNVFKRKASVYAATLPKYISLSKKYNLFENLKSNRAIIFDQTIVYSIKGVKRILIACMKTPCSGKRYYKLVDQLLKELELGGIK